MKESPKVILLITCINQQNKSMKIIMLIEYKQNIIKNVRKVSINIVAKAACLKSGMYLRRHVLKVACI